MMSSQHTNKSQHTNMFLTVEHFIASMLQYARNASILYYVNIVALLLMSLRS